MLVAVRVACPAASGVTMPVVSSTLATCGLLLVHFTARLISPAPSTVAVRVNGSLFFFTVLVVSERVTPETPLTVTVQVAFLLLSAMQVAVILATPTL